MGVCKQISVLVEFLLSTCLALAEICYFFFSPVQSERYSALAHIRSKSTSGFFLGFLSKFYLWEKISKQQQILISIKAQATLPNTQTSSMTLQLTAHILLGLGGSRVHGFKAAHILIAIQDRVAKNLLALIFFLS